jgi:2-amino-4-hydroxy-6-hydroxymethyldihydropteridine diphosphokinase
MFANAAVRGRWAGPLPALLALLKQVERDFGRRPGRRWGARVLDCDLLLADAEMWRSRPLTVPHPALPHRAFVLDPLLELWPDWRHPRSGRTVRQMRARLGKPRPRDGRPVDSPARRP